MNSDKSVPESIPVSEITQDQMSNVLTFNTTEYWYLMTAQKSDEPYGMLFTCQSCQVPK